MENNISQEEARRLFIDRVSSMNMDTEDPKAREQRFKKQGEGIYLAAFENHMPDFAANLKKNYPDEYHEYELKYGSITA